VARSLKRGKGTYPYFGANNELDRIDEYLFDEKILCVAEDGGSWGLNQRCAYIVNEKCWVNNHAHVLTAKEGVSLEFLKYFLNQTDLNPFISGTTRGKLTRAALDRIPIPFPPFETQQRIAAVLDKADALLEKRRQAINKLDTLPQSVFLDMFGDPLRNPKRFEEGILEKSIRLKGGFAFSSADYAATGIPLVKIGEVNRAEFKPESLSFLPTHFLSTHSRFVLHAGDLVMSLTGTTGKEDYANVVMLGNDYDKYFLNQRVALIQPNESIYTREYLLCLLKDSGIKRQITSKSRGIRQANISNSDILHLKVAIPPLDLQKRFSSLFIRIKGLGVKQSRAASRSNDLFQGLQQAAFKGELFKKNYKAAELLQAVSRPSQLE
jgi:type I restriction enzyme S subunit